MTPNKTKPVISKEGKQAAANIAAARANLNAGGKRQGNTIAAPTGTTTTPPPVGKPTTPVITPATLEPSAAPTVTPTPPQTAAPKLQADLEAQTEDALTQKVAAEKTAAEASKGTAFQTYLDRLTNAKGLTTLQSEAYAQKGGVNDITPELNDINDQIRREQLALRRATESVTKQGGQSKAQAQAQINNLTRESLAKQADLAVIQMAVQGRYDSAKEIADRAVAAQFEQQQQAIDIAKFDYTENKDLFTKAEQREYDLLFSNRQNAIEEAKANKAAIQNFALSALQAGASTAEARQAMGAKTLDEAIGLVGGYLRPKPAAVGSSKPSITEIDGKPYVWDETTGQYVPAGEYIKGGGMDTAQQQQINDTLALARSLKRSDAVGKGSAVGASWAKFVPFGQSLGLQGDRTAFENKVNTLKANLTLDNLGLLKGPMSDKDLAFLQAVGSSLTTDMSEAEFDKELGKVINKLQGAKAPTTFQSNPTALPFGSQNLLQQSAQPLLAPDGTQVIITD